MTVQLKPSVMNDAQCLWDFHHMDHVVKPADCLLVLGSHDLQVAKRAIELFEQGYSDLLVFSGAKGKITEGLWDKSEAEIFANIAYQAGVPKKNILLEKNSTNTGQNIQFSMCLLAELGLTPQKVIIVHKPYLERRSYATFKLQFPDIAVSVTSQLITMEQYLHEVDDVERVINLMVGDLQRLQIYADKGFQIKQNIPETVVNAYHQLIQGGFDRYLLFTPN